MPIENLGTSKQGEHPEAQGPDFEGSKFQTDEIDEDDEYTRDDIYELVINGNYETLLTLEDVVTAGDENDGPLLTLEEFGQKVVECYGVAINSLLTEAESIENQASAISYTLPNADLTGVNNGADKLRQKAKDLHRLRAKYIAKMSEHNEKERHNGLTIVFPENKDPDEE